MPDPVPAEAAPPAAADPSKSFRARIRAARKARGWSQAELASRLGHAQAVVSRWEAGRRGMDVCDLMAVADALDVPPAHLLGGNGSGSYEAGFRDGVAAARAAIERLGDPDV